jgi:hypothetical protein
MSALAIPIDQALLSIPQLDVTRFIERWSEGRSRPFALIASWFNKVRWKTPDQRYAEFQARAPNCAR